MPDDSVPAPSPTPAGSAGLMGAPQGPTAPATVAPKSTGLEMRGRVLVKMGLDLLSKAAALIGVANEDGQELFAALSKLGKRFGNASGDLQQQELKLMGSQLPGVQRPTNPQALAMQQMLKQKQGAAATPPGATPPPGGMAA